MQAACSQPSLHSQLAQCLCLTRKGHTRLKGSPFQACNRPADSFFLHCLSPLPDPHVPSPPPFPTAPTCLSSWTHSTAPRQNTEVLPSAPLVRCWGASTLGSTKQADHPLVGCQAEAGVPPCWTLEAVDSHRCGVLCPVPSLPLPLLPLHMSWSYLSPGQLVQKVRLAEN